jgi:hypothetical protein
MQTKFKCKQCKINKISYRTFHCGSGLCKSCAKKGKNNPNYKDGRTFKLYKCKTKDCNNMTTGKGKTGMCASCNAKLRIGKKNSHYKHGEYCKDKKYYCKCGKRITGWGKTGLCNSCSQKGKKLPKVTCNKMSNSHKGKNHHMWGKHHKKETRKKISLSHGGTGTPFENRDLKDSIRRLSEYCEWRTEVFKRDNYTCQECGQVGYELEAHHIKEFSIIFKEFLHFYSKCNLIEDKQTLLNLAIKYKPFWNLKNGITLCKKCHKLTDNYGSK